MTTYKESGVDIKLGNKCSQVMYEACKKTFANREGKLGEPIDMPGGFSGPIYIEDLKDAVLLKNSDGVGTKVTIAHGSDKHDTIGFDLLAMVCDDAACLGAEPIAVTNTLNVNSLSLGLIEELAKGLVDAAQVAQVAVVGGEIAELGKKISSGYLWDADVVSIMDRKKWAKAGEIKPGDLIVGVTSDGFRSNGFSLIRRVLHDNLGSNWVNKKFSTRLRWGDITLKPSRIYTPFLVDCFGTYGEPPSVKIMKAAHITGGGIPDNLSRVLPPGLGAEIKPPKPHQPMLILQEMGKISDREAYRTWNMGVGLCIVTNDKTVLKKAAQHNLSAHIMGEVTNRPQIEIMNKGYWQTKGELYYEI